MVYIPTPLCQERAGNPAAEPEPHTDHPRTDVDITTARPRRSHVKGQKANVKTPRRGIRSEDRGGGEKQRRENDNRAMQLTQVRLFCSIWTWTNDPGRRSTRMEYRPQKHRDRRESDSRGRLFYRLLEQAVVIEPTTGADLKGHASALE